MCPQVNGAIPTRCTLLDKGCSTEARVVCVCPQVNGDIPTRCTLLDKGCSTEARVMCVPR